MDGKRVAKAKVIEMVKKDKIESVFALFDSDQIVDSKQDARAVVTVIFYNEIIGRHSIEFFLKDTDIAISKLEDICKIEDVGGVEVEDATRYKSEPGVRIDSRVCGCVARRIASENKTCVNPFYKMLKERGEIIGGSETVGSREEMWAIVNKLLPNGYHETGRATMGSWLNIFYSNDEGTITIQEQLSPDGSYGFVMVEEHITSSYQLHVEFRKPSED